MSGHAWATDMNWISKNQQVFLRGFIDTMLSECDFTLWQKKNPIGERDEFNPSFDDTDDNDDGEEETLDAWVGNQKQFEGVQSYWLHDFQ